MPTVVASALYYFLDMAVLTALGTVGVTVLSYAIASRGTPIYEMVSSAYQVTLVSAFVPLTFGLYWKGANTTGAIAAIVLGISSWLVFLLTPLGADWPAPLVGVLMAVIGMVVGSKFGRSGPSQKI